jgi:hypothetical protein
MTQFAPGFPTTPNQPQTFGGPQSATPMQGQPQQFQAQPVQGFAQPGTFPGGAPQAQQFAPQQQPMQQPAMGQPVFGQGQPMPQQQFAPQAQQQQYAQPQQQFTGGGGNGTFGVAQWQDEAPLHRLPPVPEGRHLLRVKGTEFAANSPNYIIVEVVCLDSSDPANKGREFSVHYDFNSGGAAGAKMRPREWAEFASSCRGFASVDEGRAAGYNSYTDAQQAGAKTGPGAQALAGATVICTGMRGKPTKKDPSKNYVNLAWARFVQQ